MPVNANTPMPTSQRIVQVGLPQPAALWLGYLVPEPLLAFVMASAHAATTRHASVATVA